MTIWKYTAIPLSTGVTASAATTGELAGESASEVRAALRRIGLQVIELKPQRRSRSRADTSTSTTVPGDLRIALTRTFVRQLRARRRHERAELYDSVATMLESGLPLLEAVDAIVSSTKSRRSPLRSMLVQLRENLRGGTSLAESMAQHPSWFDPCEIAMVRAGQHGGTLPAVLKTLAERHERSGELSHKLISALTYPMIVTMVAVGVVVFLSVKTLPTLASILIDGGVEVPALTAGVMWFGQFLAAWWWLLAIIALATIVLAPVMVNVVARRPVSPGLDRTRGESPASGLWISRLHPRVMRRMAISRLSLQMAELLRAGVPMVDALRVLAPTMPGLLLREQLLRAAVAVEHGEDISQALCDEHYFDAEFRRLLDIGQTTGELDSLLERVGLRYARQAARLIDRLSAILEPVVIITLATGIGVVVIAAILPLLRIREVLG